MIDHMLFRVEYTALARGHLVVVDAGEGRTARIEAPEAKDALDFAAAFMRGVVEPDPIEEAFRLPSAADGPREQG